MYVATHMQRIKALLSQHIIIILCDLTVYQASMPYLISASIPLTQYVGILLIKHAYIEIHQVVFKFIIRLLYIPQRTNTKHNNVKMKHNLPHNCGMYEAVATCNSCQTQLNAACAGKCSVCKFKLHYIAS